MKIKDGLLALGCALVLTGALRAETNSTPPRWNPQRFLFVVDTGRSTRKVDEGIRQALFDLIYFGIEGQMKKGDTFGIWTYNEQVNTGKFPMMTWDPDRVLELATAGSKFLQSQKLAGDSDPVSALARVASVVRSVKDVNVFLITDGKTLLERTLYDHQVNPVYTQRKREVEKSKKPLITSFIARGGQVTNASVTLAGEPILLPPPSPPAPKLAQSPKGPGARNLPRSAKMTPIRRTNSTPLVMRPSGTTFSTRFAPASPAASTPTTQQPANPEPPESSIIDPAGFIGSNEALGDSSQPKVGAARTNDAPATSSTLAVAALETSTAPRTTVAPLSPAPANPSAANPITAAARDTNITTGAAGALATVLPATPVAAREFAATPANRGGFSTLTLISAGAFLLAASLALLVFGFRRNRLLPAQPSFISQSMER